MPKPPPILTGNLAQTLSFFTFFLPTPTKSISKRGKINIFVAYNRSLIKLVKLSNKLNNRKLCCGKFPHTVEMLPHCCSSLAAGRETSLHCYGKLSAHRKPPRTAAASFPQVGEAPRTAAAAFPHTGNLRVALRPIFPIWGLLHPLLQAHN